MSDRPLTATSFCDPSHEHSESCGHLQIEHDDHIAYLHDGHLHCKVKKDENKEEQLVQHAFNNQLETKCSNLRNWAPSHRDTHSHDESCGHPRVKHEDHWDFLVDNELHHFHDDHCDHHGKVKVRQRLLTRPERRKHVEEYIKENPHHTSDYRTEALHWSKDKDAFRFFIAFFLTGGYCVVEFAVGILIGSLALIADALHMFSDLISLAIGFYALESAKKSRSKDATYGYHRMEVVGGLINSVFLLAICLSLLLDVIERFLEPPNETLLKEGNLLIIVAGVGLGINILGMLVFAGSGAGHGHSHGGSAPAAEAIELTADSDMFRTGTTSGAAPGQDSRVHIHEPDTVGLLTEKGHEEKKDPKKEKGHTHSHGGDHGHGDHGHGGEKKEHLEVEEKKEPKKKKGDGGHGHSHGGGNLNIQGVLIHVAGDALGSVAVIISGLIIKYLDSPQRFYADPIVTLFITILILCSSIPLVRKTTAILLQKVPPHMDLDDIEEKVKRVKGVIQIHDFHLWQIAQEKMVASVHVIIRDNENFMRIADKIKEILHSVGVHSSTIQPEFIHEDPTDGVNDLCSELLCRESTCIKKSCCPVNSTASRSIGK